MHEQPGHDSWASITVLIRAPDCEIGVPVVQFQKHITVRMGQIPSNEDTKGLGMCGDLLDVEKLPSIVLDAREEDKSSFISVLVDVRDDSLRGDLVFPIFWGNENHGLLRVQAMPGDMGFDSVLSSQTRREQRCGEPT